MYLYVKLNRDAECIKSASCEKRNMSARRGALFVPIEIPTMCWKNIPAKTTKMLSIRNKDFMMSSLEYLLLDSECSFTKYVCEVSSNFNIPAISYALDTICLHVYGDFDLRYIAFIVFCQLNVTVNTDI